MYSDNPADDHVIKTRRHLFIFNRRRKHFLFLFYDLSNKHDISDDATA